MIETFTDALNRLAAFAGIESGFTDYWGNERQTSPETQRALLEAMGMRVDSDAAIEATLRDLEERSWRRGLEPVLVVPFGAFPRVAVARPRASEDRLIWSLVREDGRRFQEEACFSELPFSERREIDGVPFERRVLEIALPSAELPMGYHRLTIEDAALTLIVVPSRCYLPPMLERGGKLWGFALQLYSLRSRRNWGVGDFGDLATLGSIARGCGASFLALNPLHELDPANPSSASPYSPSSRLLLDVMYLDVEAIADFAECPAARSLVASAEFRSELESLRATELVEYERVWHCKRRVLDLLYGWFRAEHLTKDSARAEEFRRFLHDGGKAVEGVALYEALREHFVAQGVPGYGWSSWPTPYQNPSSPEVMRFAREARERLEFYAYLQWQCEAQLAEAASAVRDMEIGLYRDLAVGAQRDGADGWLRQDVLLATIGVGAPPDPLNTLGQSWGVSPFDPFALRERAYAPFIELLRANMRSAGALRIDHVMGLMRLFSIPPGRPAAEGAYLAMPFEDLLGILALESRRQRCMVVGEDLGTVPPGFRERMQRAGVLSCRLLYFERRRDGAYRLPGEYPVLAVASPGTHDLATLSAFWLGADVELRDSLGLLPPDQGMEDAQRERTWERAGLIATLRESGELHEEIAARLSDGRVPERGDVAPLIASAYRFLARTPSRLLAASLEDALGVVEQINVPGTFFEHPNWRRKLPVELEELAREERFVAFTAGLNEVRVSSAPPTVPGSTYRLQLNASFRFADAERLIPYLASLGISHVYASPIFAARPGSAHGYDIIDHDALNPELGTREEFDRFVATLHRHEMGLLLDVVPNHMGIGGAENPWWLDVLEWGENSPFASWFDIDWQADGDWRGKVLVPFLGDRLGEVLRRGELRLRLDAERGSFDLWYHQHRFPLALRSYVLVLDALPAALAEIRNLLANFGGSARSAAQAASLRERAESVHREIAAVARDADLRASIAATLDELCAIGERKRSVLQSILRLQHYRLASWRVASDEINYRRFFDINELAGLRVEVAECFARTHRLLFELLENGAVQGIRIDHIDGLFDPAGYCALLRERATLTGAPLYVVVEKILARHEALRGNWAVAGTTGYEIGNLINALFVDPDAEERFDRLYRSFTRTREDFDAVAHACKLAVMDDALASELHVLASEFDRIARSDIASIDYTIGGIRAALREIVAAFPVYRTYIDGEGASPEDRRDIEWAITIARRRRSGPDDSIFDFIASILTTDAVRGERPRYVRRQVVHLAMKFQQYTAPVFAKAVEDTAFYRYVRLISLNEVGGEARRFGIAPQTFHKAMRERAQSRPYALSTSSTHDSKRSEDVRARLDVLSESTPAWRRALLRFERFNRRHKREVEGQQAPDRVDEYYLYQTLLGSWPLELLAHEPGTPENGAYAERIEQHLVKALREAKRHTSWSNPNPEYEEATIAFVRGLFAEPSGSLFWNEFFTILEPVARIGAINSLAQSLLRLTVPGVPDTYRGTELWDFSLVDPDNRRPVDFARREALLAELERGAPSPERAAALLHAWRDGRVKLEVVRGALLARRERLEAFLRREYVPLEVVGCERNALAFEHGECITVVPRLIAGLVSEEVPFPIGEGVWGDSALLEPEALCGRRYRHAYTGRCVILEKRTPLATIFAEFPVALLVPDEEITLSAGGA